MSTEEQRKLPPPGVWDRIVTLAIEADKPIMMDYWIDSLDKKVVLGIRENKEKLLVKSTEEYTSPIKDVARAGPDIYIISTENSIYVVSSHISIRKIS
jgi:hypothetical protein